MVGTLFDDNEGSYLLQGDGKGGFIWIERASINPLFCLFVCIDRFKSRVTTFHINRWDANVFFRV